MIKSNIFYLFLVAIFLTLSVLSCYWFNNVDSYTDTYSAKENPVLENSENIWYKFKAVLSFLDILGNYSNDEDNYEDINIVDNPIKKSAKVISTFEVNNELENENEKNEQKQEKSVSSSISEVIEDKGVKEKKWYKKYSHWISEKGFYVLKKDGNLELGWQNPQGKTYSISIPY
ncbi:hypothetical protein K9M50_01550 [Patescibacteria group bacterium]|nr:hypothetical protein [Patescibacteria group bacterium]